METTRKESAARTRTRATVAETFAIIGRELGGGCTDEEVADMGLAEFLRRRAAERAPGERETTRPVAP